MRRGVIWIAGAAAVAVGAHTLIWHWAVGKVADQYGIWVQQQKAQGVIVTAETPTRAGWPLAAQLAIPAMRIEAGPSRPASASWRGEQIVLGVALLHPRTLVISVKGTQALHLGDGPDIPFTADRFRAVVPLEPGQPARSFELDASQLRADLPRMPGGSPSGGLTIALLSVHAEAKPAATQGEPAISFAGSAQDIGLPPQAPGRTWPLGARIASISVEGALNGPLPRVAVPLAKATAWRDGGGTFEITRFALGWGPLGLNGSATLALDEHMQPMGTATAHFIGQNEALDALAAGGVMNQRTAIAAKAVLGLMAKAPDGGGAPQVDVPLTLQDRKLAMGRIPLAVMPELVWQSAPQ